MGRVIELTSRVQKAALEKALKARQEFLNSLSGEKRKKALEFQKEIYEKLKHAGSQHNRLVLINQMMMDKVAEFGEECEELSLRLCEVKSKLV